MERRERTTYVVQQHSLGGQIGKEQWYWYDCPVHMNHPLEGHDIETAKLLLAQRQTRHVASKFTDGQYRIVKRKVITEEEVVLYDTVGTEA